MSHALKQRAFEELTQEEQIQYVETHFDEIVAGLRADKTISSWDAEMLADRLSRYRWQVENAIPWDELREEFLKG